MARYYRKTIRGSETRILEKSMSFQVSLKTVQGCPGSTSWVHSKGKPVRASQVVKNDALTCRSQAFQDIAAACSKALSKALQLSCRALRCPELCGS